MKKSDLEIHIRRRNEHMIKFWAEYILLLMIAFIGVYFILPPPKSAKVAFSIFACLMATFLCFCWFMIYHKKTSDLIMEK